VIVTERRAGTSEPDGLNPKLIAADFQVKNVEQDLNRLLSENTAGTTLRERPL